MKKDSLKNLIKKRIRLTVGLLGLVILIIFSLVLILYAKNEFSKVNQDLSIFIENVSQKDFFLKALQEGKDVDVFFDKLAIQRNEDMNVHVHYEKVRPKIKNSFFRDVLPIPYDDKILGYLVIIYSLDFLMPYFYSGLIAIFVLLVGIYLALQFPARIFERELLSPIIKTINIKGSNIEEDFKRIDEITSDASPYVELKLFQRKLRFLLKRKENTAFFYGLGMMGSRLSHDIKKPFSKIKIILDEMLKEDITKDELKKIKVMLNKDLDYVESLLQNMVSLSSKMVLHKEDVNLYRMLESCLQIVCSKHMNNDVKITFDLNHKMMMKVDPNQITRVLINIIDNAFDALRKQGHLWIRSKDEIKGGKDYLHLTIGNDGPLISEEKIPLMFKLGQSGKRGGSGLGLMSVKQVMDAHKAEVWCSSSKETGTEFHMLLPVSKKPDRALDIDIEAGLPKRKTVEVKPTKVNEEVLKSLHVISVDDEDFYVNHINKLCDRLHVRHSGFNGRTDLYKVIDTLKPDIAFLDLSFDGETYCGYTVIGEMLKRYPECYVCFHSSHIAQVEEMRAKELGAKRFIEKTLTYKEFQEICAIVSHLKEEKNKNSKLKVNNA